jgi:hypothetical protein
MVYYLCACGLLNIYNFTSVLKKYQQRISGIIAWDDNLVKGDAKKYQQLATSILVSTTFHTFLLINLM